MREALVKWRWEQISSWHWAGEPKDDFIRDQWDRDTQLAMGQPGDRGEFYHLYINGLYWGLLANPNAGGAIYFTLDGSDPREHGIVTVSLSSFRGDTSFETHRAGRAGERTPAVETV